MADLQHVYADQLLNKWTLVSFQQTLVTKVVAQICQRPFYLFLHHSAPLCSSSQQVSGGEEIDSGVTHVLMFETCGNVFSACVRSQIERVTHSRVRYRLTDVLAREDKGKTERRDKGVEEAELFTQCRTTWSAAGLTRDPPPRLPISTRPSWAQPALFHLGLGRMAALASICSRLTSLIESGR